MEGHARARRLNPNTTSRGVRTPAADLASGNVTNERVRVYLNGPPQTMLATLYAKALDADLEEPILGDRFAKQIVERID